MKNQPYLQSSQLIFAFGVNKIETTQQNKMT